MRTCLDRLQAAGIISPCDPDIVAARIKRADRRSHGWDLNVGMVRDDDIAVGEHHVPGVAARLATAAQPGTDDHAVGVQPLIGFVTSTPPPASIWRTVGSSGAIRVVTRPCRAERPDRQAQQLGLTPADTRAGGSARG